MNVAACICMYMLHVPPVYILLIQQLSCFFPVGSPFSPWGPHYSGENGDPGIPIFMGSPKFYDSGCLYGLCPFLEPFIGGAAVATAKMRCYGRVAHGTSRLHHSVQSLLDLHILGAFGV